MRAPALPASTVSQRLPARVLICLNQWAMRLVGVIAVRNAIFKLMTARAQWQIIVKDADDPPLRVKPVS